MKNNFFLLFILLFPCLLYSQKYAVSFDGVNDYMEVADQNAIDLSGTLTIEAWIYPAGAGSDAIQGGIIVNKESSYEIARFADGTIQYAFSANGAGTDWSWTNTAITAPLNQWTHIALVKSGTAITLYINAISVFTNNAAPATLTANTQALRVAGRTTGPHHFNGYIDQLRIWNTARTQSEIRKYLFDQNLARGTSGLVAYYKLNEGSGTTSANYGNTYSGLNATLTNGPVWVSSPAEFSANGLAFDGSNDNISIADNNSLDISSAITIETWVYATKNSGIQNVICKSSLASNNGYIFPRTDDGWSTVIIYLHTGAGWQTLSAPYPSLNAWHHLAASYEGTTVKLYIDGEIAASRSLTGSITANTNALTFGNQPGFTEFYGGYLDEVRIWNVARTQAQIQANMKKELDPALQSGLVSYYTFNQGNQSGSNAGLLLLPDLYNTNNGTLTNFTLSGAGSNFVNQYSGHFTLPLQWLSFTASQQSGNCILQWQTAAEQNVSAYKIWHSADNRSWNQLGQVSAISVQDQPRYSYTDLRPAAGSHYYRIEETDIDGRSSFSETRIVRIDNSNAQIIFNNPVTDGILRLKLEQPGQVSLYDQHGRIVFKKNYPAGLLQADLSNLPSGMYTLLSGVQRNQLLILK